MRFDSNVAKNSEIFCNIVNALRSDAMDVHWQEVHDKLGLVAVVGTGSASLALFPEYGIMDGENKADQPFRAPGDFDVFPYVKESLILSNNPSDPEALGQAVIGLFEKAAIHAGYEIKEYDEAELAASRKRAKSEGGSKFKTIIIDPASGAEFEVSTRGNMPWQYLPAVSPETKQPIMTDDLTDERVIATHPAISFCDKMGRAKVWDGAKPIRDGAGGTRKAKSNDPLDLHWMLETGFINPSDQATKEMLQFALLQHEVHWGNYAKLLGSDFADHRRILHPDYDPAPFIDSLQELKGITLSEEQAKAMLAGIRQAFCEVLELSDVQDRVTIYSPKELAYLESVFHHPYNEVLTGKPHQEVQTATINATLERLENPQVRQAIFQGKEIPEEIAKEDISQRVIASPHRKAVEAFAVSHLTQQHIYLQWDASRTY